MSVVPVAVASVVGALASIRTVRLAWSEESYTSRKILLALLLLPEFLHLLLPLGAFRGLFDEDSDVAVLRYHKGVLALIVFLGILNFQEFVTFVFSFSKSWSIHADLKSAELVPVESNLHSDDKFKRPLLLIVIGSLLAILLPLIGVIVAFVGFVLFIKTLHQLSKAFPDNQVLATVSIAWIARIALKVLQYIILIPLAFKFVSDAQVDENGDLIGFPDFVFRLDRFLSSFVGALLIGVILAYKLVVLASTGYHFLQRKNHYRFVHNGPVGVQHHQYYNYPIPAAHGFGRLPAASIEEGSVQVGASAAPPQAPAPSAPQGYAFYM